MIFISIILIIVFLFLLNEFYFWVILGNCQEQQILKGKKGKNYNWIAFGSSYCRYGLNSSENEVGFNFGVAAQFLYYSDKMLREYAVSCLKNKGTVFLIIADLVFAEVGRGWYDADRYQLLLSRESLDGDSSIKVWIRLRFPLIIHPFLLRRILAYVIKRHWKHKDSYSTLEVNTLSDEEVDAAAVQRCRDWCSQFGLKDTWSTNISEKLELKFSQTRKILSEMIKFCYDNGYNPILVVTPVSGTMNKHLGEDFIKKVLYDNIEKANDMGAPFLDYLRDERFMDAALYHNNADFLNARGRRLFTKILLNDAKKINKNEDRNTNIS